MAAASALNPDARCFAPANLAVVRYPSPSSVLALSYPPPPPPPLYDQMVACGWGCGGGFLSKLCCCPLCVGVPYPNAMFVPSLTQPVPPMAVYCCPPPPPALAPAPELAAPRCFITEIIEDGGEESGKAGERRPVEKPSAPRAGVRPSALSRLPPRRRAALPPQPPQAAPRVPARAGNARRGRRALEDQTFDPKANRTSLMIRNIPVKFMKQRLMAILDQFCFEHNSKLSVSGSEGGQVKSEYDFFYLPIDFRTDCNKGYAFVNLTTAEAARRLHGFLHGHRWKAASSYKVCEVAHAHIEGLEALLAHFSDSRFPCQSTDYLPVRFDPPRDGVRPTTEHVVGLLR